MSEITQLKDKVEEKAKLAEASAKAQALSAVNTEKSWLRQNWRQLVGFAVAIAIVVYIIHKL